MDELAWTVTVAVGCLALMIGLVAGIWLCNKAAAEAVRRWK